MTETDRQQIADEEREDDENKRYQAVSRVRSRIREELPEDVAILRENHPELYQEIQEIVCEEKSD
jgi:hypothetical protein